MTCFYYTTCQDEPSFLPHMTPVLSSPLPSPSLPFSPYFSPGGDLARGLNIQSSTQLNTLIVKAQSHSANGEILVWGMEWYFEIRRKERRWGEVHEEARAFWGGADAQQVISWLRLTVGPPAASPWPRLLIQVPPFTLSQESQDTTNYPLLRIILLVTSSPLSFYIAKVISPRRLFSF